MARKIVATLAVFALLCVGVFAAAQVASVQVGLPEPIAETSPCPATGCASGMCHGFDDVPEPDGVHEMACPEASCSSVECHAWDTLLGRYHQASDASLNVWVLMPVALVVALVLVVRKVR